MDGAAGAASEKAERVSEATVLAGAPESAAGGSVVLGAEVRLLAPFRDDVHHAEGHDGGADGGAGGP